MTTPATRYVAPERSSRVDDLGLIVRRVISEARDDRITTTAQALAYSTFLAIPAVFLVVLGVFSLFANPADVETIIDRMRGVIPPEAATLLSESLNRSANSPGSGLLMAIVGVGLAIWTTTSAATTLMQSITTAFDRADRRRFLHKRLLALAIVFCLVAAAALVGCLLVFGPYVERWLGDATSQPGLVAWVWWTVQWPVLVLALLAAFAVLLYVGPDVEQPSWKWVTPGAIVALVIWLASSGALSLYASRFGSYEKTWGALSAVVVLLIWLWLTNLALLLGAEVNAEIESLAAERAGAASAPESMPAERHACTEAGEQPTGPSSAAETPASPLRKRKRPKDGEPGIEPTERGVT
jgi:membrane protein